MSLDKLYSVTNFIRAFKFDVCGNALELKSKELSRANKQKRKNKTVASKTEFRGNSYGAEMH